MSNESDGKSVEIEESIRTIVEVYRQPVWQYINDQSLSVSNSALRCLFI